MTAAAEIEPAVFQRWYILEIPGDGSWGNNMERVATLVGPQAEADKLVNLLNALGKSQDREFGYSPAIGHP